MLSAEAHVQTENPAATLPSSSGTPARWAGTNVTGAVPPTAGIRPPKCGTLKARAAPGPSP